MRRSMRTWSGFAVLLVALLVAVPSPLVVGQDPPSREEAGAAFERGDFEQAARLYDALAAANPEEWQFAFRAAFAWHSAGDYRRSIDAHRAAARFEEARPVCLYNIACAHAMLGEREAALDALERALGAGFDRLDAIEDDADLASLRDHPRFARLLAKARGRGGEDGAAADLTWETIDDRMRALEADGFSGALLVERDGEIAHLAGYGLANREKGIAVTPDTVFAVGSVPIDFTHVSILKLAEAGRLDLDDPITRFLDAVPEDKQAITIEHLMTGGSGLRDFHDLPGDRDPDHAWIDRDEAVRRILGQNLLFAPGTGRQHSHSAWGLLAAIVEIASGQSYAEFTRAHVYEPAGMTSTGFNGDPIPEDRLAIGYEGEADGTINAPPYWGPTSWLVMGSGGQVSTVKDLYRFQEALRDGRLLEPESVKRYFGPLDGRGVATAGDVYGFECAYSQRADDKFILLTNSIGLETSPLAAPLRRLVRDLDALVNASADARALAAPEPASALDPAERTRRALAWIASLNAADPAAYVEFGRTHRPPADDQAEADAARAEQHADFRERWGELDDARVTFNTADRVVVIARTGTGEPPWLEVSFAFQTETPHHIVGIGLRPREAPGDAAAADDDDGPGAGPAGPRERRALGFIEALNSGDPEAYVRYMRTHRVVDPESPVPDEERRTQFRDLSGELGRVTVRGVEDDGTRMTISATGAASGPVQITFTFADGPDPLVDTINIDFASGGGDVAFDAGEWTSLEGLLENVRGQFEIPALAMAVVRDGAIVDAAAVGVRRTDRPDPVELDDRFYWASVGKSMTGTMLGRLFEQGVMSPSMTIGTVLGDLDMLDVYRDVTLEQLMCHRGGLQPYGMIDPSMMKILDPEGKDDLEKRHRFAARVLSEEPVATPGRRQAYSNAGIAIAGHMAEVVTGKSWETLVRELVLEPAGLRETGFGWPTGDDQPFGHMGGRGRPLVPIGRAEMPRPMAIAPAGGIHSSIEDFARYALMHLRGLRGADGVLRAETVQRIHTPLPGPGERYAFGWGITEWPGDDVECHWHNGGGGASYAEIRLLPEHDAAVVLMLNANGPGQWFGSALAEAAVRRLVIGDGN